MNRLATSSSALIGSVFLPARLVRHTVPGTPVGVRSSIPLGRVYYICAFCTPRVWGDQEAGGQYRLESTFALREEPEGEITSGVLPLGLFAVDYQLRAYLLRWVAGVGR